MTVAVAVGWLAVVIGWMYFRRPRKYVSDEWLTEQRRLARDEYDGPVWSWPVDKRYTENGWWNRYKETERRKRA